MVSDRARFLEDFIRSRVCQRSLKTRPLATGPAFEERRQCHPWPPNPDLTWWGTYRARCEARCSLATIHSPHPIRVLRRPVEPEPAGWCFNRARKFCFPAAARRPRSSPALASTSTRHGCATFTAAAGPQQLYVPGAARGKVGQRQCRLCLVRTVSHLMAGVAGAWRRTSGHRRSAARHRWCLASWGYLATPKRAGMGPSLRRPARRG